MYNQQKERLYEAGHTDDDSWKPTYGYNVQGAYGSTGPTPIAHYQQLEQTDYYSNSQQYYKKDEHSKTFAEYKEPEEQQRGEYSRYEMGWRRDNISESKKEKYRMSSERDRPRSNLVNVNLTPLPKSSNNVDKSNTIPNRSVAQMDIRKCPPSSKYNGTEPKRKQGISLQKKNQVARVSVGETPTSNPRTPAVSATLFLELSAERRIKLQEMAEKFSGSLDSNSCKSVLDEVEFLLKLFCTASKDEYVTPEEESEDDPLFYNATEQIDFVIKVIIAQLDNLFVNLPRCVIQLIIDNYPHRILQRAKKQIDDWMIAQEAAELQCMINKSPTHLAATVTEKNINQMFGPSTFSNESDYKDFCRQRDIYFGIRTTWTSMINDQANNSDSQPNEVITLPKNLDSFHAKTCQLFQINRSPINMFRLASLFISHCLSLEQTQEALSASKNSNNVQKGLSPESKRILEFQRQFLLSSSPIFTQHVVDKLLLEITQTEESMGSTNLVIKSAKLCRTMKDSIYLARLLGVTLFLPYVTATERKPGSIIGMDPAESLRARSYQGPPLDLVDYMKKALKCGRLITTCPWIVEYLLYCDPVAFLLPSYKSVLAMLVYLYKRVLVASSTSYPISVGNKNFLRFYFGMLFSSDKLPSSAFTLESQEVPFDAAKETEGRVDMCDEIGKNMIEYFFHSSFNRFRRILGWRTLEFPIGDRAFTGNEFQHVLSVVEGANNSTTTTPSSDESTNPMLQAQLEATFFESHSPAVKRNIEFIAESVWSNFLIFAKSDLLPFFKTLITNQGMFGEAAAKKCRMRIGEEMTNHMPQRCIMAVKVCMEQLVTHEVLQLCWRIALQKAKNYGWNWINSNIKADMFPEGEKISSNASSSPETFKLEEDPPTEILMLIRKMIRQLHSDQSIDFKEFNKSIDKVLTCQTLVNVKENFNPIADWTFALIAFQPHCFHQNRMGKVVTLWKRICPKEANIINPRNLSLLTHTGFTNNSWLKLGKLTQHLLKEGVLTPSELEQQCLELSRHNWCDTKTKKMVVSDYLTMVMDTYNKKNGETGTTNNAQYLVLNAKQV